MNKKILFGMLVIGLISALAGAGMYAYFSDTETSTGNVFTAGTVDLTITAEAPIDLPNMKPGDIDSGSITVKNTGSLSGCLYATSDYVKTGDTDADEFAKMLLITAFTADAVDMLAAIPEVDGNPGKSVYDMVNDPSGLTLTGYPDSPGRLGTWYSYDTDMTPGEEHTYSLTVEFDTEAGDAYEGQGITLTFYFLLTQQ